MSRLNWPIGALIVPAKHPDPRVNVPLPIILMILVAAAVPVPAAALVTAVMLPLQTTVPFEIVKVLEHTLLTV